MAGYYARGWINRNHGGSCYQNCAEHKARTAHEAAASVAIELLDRLRRMTNAPVPDGLQAASLTIEVQQWNSL